MTTRIAMWSGPRNLSTALMRSFGSRADTIVVDEPFYAHYLEQTGLEHPLREAVIASQPSDWREVAATLTGPCETAVHYQKHMAHHRLPGMEGPWLFELTHVLLLRHPRLMVESYARAREHFDAADLGLLQLLDLFETLRATEQPVWVIDSHDILENPARCLERLCDAVDISWDPAMLSWPAGPHPADGVWGDHWYGGVRGSTGFGPPRRVPQDVGEHEPLVQALLPAWDTLYAASARFR